MNNLEKIQKAIKFAVKTHEVYQKQTRKGKDVSYITHPLTVGLILSKIGASDDLVCAGILHDTIEDSIDRKKVTFEMLEERFGSNVAELVASVSETAKNVSWEEKVERSLEHIKTFSQDSLLLKSADVISNTSEIIDDYGKDGEGIFERFNAPKPKKENTAQKYINVINTIVDCWPENPLKDMLVSLSNKLEIIKKFHKLKEPKLCHLWKSEKLQHKELAVGQALKEVKIFEDDSHHMKKLLKCRKCGQLYFYEFYEEMSFSDGNDSSYRTFVPVENSKIAEKIAQGDIYSSGHYSPRIQHDNTGAPLWIGKED